MSENQAIIKNTHGFTGREGSITVASCLSGKLTIMEDHGTSTAGVTVIAVFSGGATHIVWNGTLYEYEGGDSLAILSMFAATLSMGKTANFVKANSELVSGSIAA